MSARVSESSSVSHGTEDRPSVLRRVPRASRNGVGATSVTLILSQFAGSAIGLVYWLVAAHQLDKAQLGLDAAVINSALLASNLGSLDLVNAIPRYLPAAGSRSGVFIKVAYSVSVVLGLATAAVFLIGVDTWSPTLSVLVTNRAWLLWFLLTVVVWCVFSLQDSVLMGFQRSQWIPAENLSFSVLKLLMLFGFLQFAPEYALIGSWTVSAGVFVVIVNAGLVRRVVIHETVHQPSTLPPRRKLARSVLVGNSSNIIAIIIGGSLPIIVAERLGAESNASYYLAYTLSYVLFLAPRYVGLVVLAQAEHHRDRFDALAIRAALASMAVVGVSVVIAWVGAGPLLGLLDSGYDTETVELMRLMCLAAIPHCVVQLTGSWARGHQRLGLAFVITFTEYLLLGGLVLALLGGNGLMGVGWAWLITECTIALAIVLMGVRGRHISTHLVLEAARDGSRSLTRMVDRARRRSAPPTSEEPSA
jgi:O-antigen/teichoic acid export membrane protein